MDTHGTQTPKNDRIMEQWASHRSPRPVEAVSVQTLILSPGVSEARNPLLSSPDVIPW
jgi:hypothetical protein